MVVVNDPTSPDYEVRVNRIVRGTQRGRRYQDLQVQTGCKAASALAGLFPKRFEKFVKEGQIKDCGFHLRSCYFGSVLEVLKSYDSKHEKVQKAVNISLRLIINNQDFAEAINEEEEAKLFTKASEEAAIAMPAKNCTDIEGAMALTIMRNPVAIHTNNMQHSPGAEDLLGK
jgi:hypothetical protein